MEVLNKPKIEALYPLTLHQQGLLFHHLSDADDIGALLVQCKLNGKLDFAILTSAWKQTVNRHEILRSSVHWKKIETPVILVRSELEVSCERLDWSSLTSDEQEEKLKAIKSDQKNNRQSLDKNPLSKIILVQRGADSYYLLWYCHHLLLDGWSSNIILNDLMTYYGMLFSGKEVRMETVPSYKSYLNWVKNSSDIEATNYWQKTVDGLSRPLLFNYGGHYGRRKLVVKNKAYTQTKSEALIALAKKNQVTINTLFQGIWSVVLSQYFDSEDVVFGTTVSGRSSGFPKIELMTGMLTNVIPVRAKLSKDEAIFESFNKIQSQQQLARNYERFSVEELLENSEHLHGGTLFDSLFVFENFPSKENLESELQMSDFASGVSSTYPLTLIISAKNNIKIDLIFDEKVLSKNTSKWLIEQISTIITRLLTNQDLTNSELRSGLSISNKPNAAVVEKLESNNEKFVAPSNETEGVLVKIWEDVFRTTGIGVNDNFFLLGGKSLSAVKIFAKLSAKHGIKLPPTALLKHPTIADISRLINDGDTTSNDMEFIVPLRAIGNKPPLFCVHAGGGHVFFYHKMPEYLDAERPVYAIQPATNVGSEKRHKSIAEMTADYLKEMKQIQPTGPYHILVYCFSAVVGFEMMRQLKETNEEAHVMVIDTPTAQHKVYYDSNIIRAKKFVISFIENPQKAFNVTINSRIQRYSKRFKTILLGSLEDKNLEVLRHNLVVNYTKYKWHKIDCGIDLIITEKTDKNLNTKMIESWRNLVTDVSIANIQGNHATLFEEPDIRFVGEKIEELMTTNKSK